METLKRKIIVIGAGFGGITTVLKLSKSILDFSKFEIILVDRHHHQLYTPSLYEVAAIPKESMSDTYLKSSILLPLEDIIKNQAIMFLCDELVGLNKETKKITLKNTGELDYEFLVFALGSETNYFDIPGLKEYSLALKTFDDAARLRQTIENVITRKISVKIIVGGGGSSGIELVAEFVNFVCKLKQIVHPEARTCNIQFILIEAGQDILPGFDAWIIQKTRKRLAKLGVEIKTDNPITSVNEKAIVLKDGKYESYDILIWTGGVKGPEILKNLGLPLSNRGSIVVNDSLKIEGHANMYAIGDNATFINPKTQKPLAWNVPAAEAEGRIVAKNICRAIEGKTEKRFSPPSKYPFILAIGSKYAIADLLFVCFWGRSGWFAKQLVELRYLLFILPPHQALRTWYRAFSVSQAND